MEHTYDLGDTVFVHPYDCFIILQANATIDDLPCYGVLAKTPNGLALSTLKGEGGMFPTRTVLVESFFKEQLKRYRESVSYKPVDGACPA